MPELVRTVGRYGIVRELGRGGMGVVWLAWQGDLDRNVALKELSRFHASDPMFARRFVRESRFAGSLTHPNIVTVFDYFEHDGTPYIAMEYVERGSLRPYVGGLTLAQIGGVLDGLLAGLEAAAERGIVHRDLKPENVMVTGDGSVKITDFGIAKATEESGAQTAVLTQTGAAIGTPAYMSPEQATAGEIGPWTDLYSLGCIAYELFTGKPPFAEAKTPMAALVKHASEPLPPASSVADVDPEFSAWIEFLTAKDPKARPASAGAAREDLEDLLLARLGPTWRRQARLAEPQAAIPGPATPPPSVPSAPVEGIDIEGVGPDTPAPTAPPRSPRARTTTVPLAPPGETPPRGAPVVEEAPVPLARFGAVALLAALVVSLLAHDKDHWNTFAILAPWEAIGVAYLVWRSREPGLLIGAGALMTVAGIGLIKFSAQRINPLAVVFAVIVVAGGLAILAAGLRTPRPPETAQPVDPGTLILGLAGIGLVAVALFIPYDGASTLWSEVRDDGGLSAEFFFEPLVMVIAALVGLVGLGSRPRFSAPLLYLAGVAGTLHFLGVLTAAALAIGERGDVKAAGFVGLIGGALIAAAGASARRASD